MDVNKDLEEAIEAEIRPRLVDSIVKELEAEGRVLGETQLQDLIDERVEIAVEERIEAIREDAVASVA